MWKTRAPRTIWTADLPSRSNPLCAAGRGTERHARRAISVRRPRGWDRCGNCARGITSRSFRSRRRFVMPPRSGRATGTRHHRPRQGQNRTKSALRRDRREPRHRRRVIAPPSHAPDRADRGRHPNEEAAHPTVEPGDRRSQDRARPMRRLQGSRRRPQGSRRKRSGDLIDGRAQRREAPSPPKAIRRRASQGREARRRRYARAP